ncbi:cell surface glycoprotein MUC18-like [Sinocyclocheilus rhinocerous]|uniref:cell surface glycoprotein MUC18-like n=1 Tax=Sinocyclocheilus rhinocerous TaxID=307959 RepID=UPI0007B9BDBF|nr:PREDICTED: cell surface glycoprotein MUC18-like [Sinocyclocheilus rhinocerous]
MEIAARFSTIARLDRPFVEYSWEFCRLAAATALDDDTINSLFCVFSLAAWALVDLRMEDTVEVYMNKSAEIPCLYTFTEQPMMVIVQWFVREREGHRVRISFSDLTMQKVDENTTYSDRISVRSNGDGETLTIQDVKLSDEREFFCQVSGLSAGSEEGKTVLKVFDPPEPPVIEGVLSGVSVSGESPAKIASCETREGFPKPNITWYRDHIPIHPTSGLANMVTLLTRESSGLYTVQSELHYKVTKEDKDAHFSCEVSYFVPGAVRTSESKGINITVHYPTTSVEIWKESPEGLVKEGDTVELRCQGDGNPPAPIIFNREQSDVELDSYQGLLVLKEVSRADSGVYECHSLNLDAVNHDEVVDTLQLTVHYLDPAVVVPKDSEVMLKGESLTATCNALSSLETSTVWFKDGIEVGRGHIMQLQDATFDTAGQYDCEVTVPSLPGLLTSGFVHIIVQGAPQMKDAEREIELTEKVGGWVNLSCEVRGYPRPTITWSITGSQSQSWREVVKREIEDQVYSVVMLKVTTDTVAVCNSTNDFGIETKTYSIRRIPFSQTPTARKTSVDNSGVIIVVIIVSILLLAILGSVFYFLYKKGKFPCGRSGKQEIINAYSTKEKTNKDDIVVEMKAKKTEESVLLKGVNGEQKPPNDQNSTLSS